MARIRHLATNETFEVHRRTVFGRSPRADRRLQSRAASADHAAVDWNGSAWTVRDLASTNGTRLNGRRLNEKPKRLAPGDVVTFGDPEERWRWEDSAPPVPQATADDGSVMTGTPVLLQLPNTRSPKVSIYPEGRVWRLDSGTALRVVLDGERVTVGRRRFELSLPPLEVAADTTVDLNGATTTSSASLGFQVSMDREYVTMLLRVGERKHLFGARAFNSVLLELARVRLDERTRNVQETEAGWVYTDDLARALGTTVQKLNVDVHRARRAFEQTKLLSDASGIVQRRETTGQLRIGIGVLSVDDSSTGESRVITTVVTRGTRAGGLL